MNKNVTLLALVGLMGCGEGIDDELSATAETTEALQAGVRVRAAKSLQPPHWAKRFDIASTNTVYLAAEGFSGGQIATFEITEPAGNMYQRTDVPIAPHRVVAPLPVAGTWIQQFSMTGKWRINVFVDGAPQPAGSDVITLR